MKMLLTQAGGIKEEAGGNPDLHIIQASSNKESIIAFKELMTPNGGNEVTLSPGDIVLCPRADSARSHTC